MHVSLPLQSILVALSSLALATAQSDPYIGQLMLFAGNFAPNGWAFCNGQQLNIAQNTALFSILGTTYGGDGRTNFNLPDLRGRFPIGMGQGNGLPQYNLGQQGGGQGSNIQSGSIVAGGTITIKPENLPAHSHTATFNGSPLNANVDTKLPIAQAPGQAGVIANGYIAQGSNSGTGQANIFVSGDTTANKVTVNGGSGTVSGTPAGTVNVDSTGSGTALPVQLNVGGQIPAQLPPFLGMNYVIALQGIYPTRS